MDCIIQKTTTKVEQECVMQNNIINSSIQSLLNESLELFAVCNESTSTPNNNGSVMSTLGVKIGTAANKCQTPIRSNPLIIGQLLKCLNHQWQQSSNDGINATIDSVKNLESAFVGEELQQDQSLLFIRMFTQTLTNAVVGITNLTMTITNDEIPNVNLLSTKQLELFSFTLAHIVRDIFFCPLSKYFQRLESLFTSSRNLTRCDHQQQWSHGGDQGLGDFDGNDCEQQLTPLKIFYLLYVQLLIESSSSSSTHISTLTSIHQTIRIHCLGPLLACFVIYRNKRLQCNKRKQSSMEHPLEMEIRLQFESYLAALPNQPFIIRELLALIGCKANSIMSPMLANMLYKYFTQPKGIQIVLRSILDSQASSEQETSVEKRIYNISQMIVELPIRDRTQYFKNIIAQIVTDLLVIQQQQPNQDDETPSRHKDDIYWRTGATLLDLILQQHSGYAHLIKTMIFDSINKLFVDGPNENDTRLVNDLKMAILIIHRLLLARVGTDEMIQFLAPLFFIRLEFENHIDPTKSVLDETISNLLSEVENSYILLDQCLHSDADKWFGRFKIVIQDSGQDHLSIYYQIKVEKRQTNNIMNVEQMEQVATLTEHILWLMPNSYRFQFFFHQFAKFSENNPPLMTAFLVSKLSESLLNRTISKSAEDSRENELINNGQSLQLISNTLERIINRLIINNNNNKNPNEYQPEVNDDYDEQCSLDFDNLQICISILSIFLDNLQVEENIFRDKHILEELRNCQLSLGRLLSKSYLIELINCRIDRIQTEEIYSKLDSITKINEPIQDKHTSDELEQCLVDLKHPLMPVRGHALITIKSLITRRHRSIESNRDRIISELKHCLLDNESYIYLAAINALSSFAIIHTDDILSLLLEQFSTETNRSLSDRLKTGEILLKLSQSIGDFANHYSKQFMGKLLHCIRSTSEEAIRISALSILGQYCAKLQYALKTYIVEVLSMIQSYARDPNLEVKRSAILCLRQLLQGLELETAIEIRHFRENIVNTLISYDNILDEVVLTNVTLARDELNRISSKLLESLTEESGEKYLDKTNMIPFR